MRRRLEPNRSCLPIIRLAIVQPQIIQPASAQSASRTCQLLSNSTAAKPLHRRHREGWPGRQWLDIGVAVDNDGHEDIFVSGVHKNTLYHNNGWYVSEEPPKPV
jgi:hypothetical protein